jgi:hypothetical protein
MKLSCRPRSLAGRWLVLAGAPLILILVFGLSEGPPTGTAATSPFPVHFWLSNQSLGTGLGTVNMTVQLDGAPFLSKSLDVGKQHDVDKTDTNLVSGSHGIEVTVSPYSTANARQITVDHELWVLIRFWYDPVSAHASQHTPTITIDVFDHNPGIK